MKNFLSGLFATLFFCIIIPGIGGYIETNYTREAEIVVVKADYIIAEDSTGNQWEFEGEGFEVGQQVVLKMFNGCTDDTIEDDEVRGVKILKK